MSKTSFTPTTKLLRLKVIFKVLLSRTLRLLSKVKKTSHLPQWNKCQRLKSKSVMQQTLIHGAHP